MWNERYEPRDPEDLAWSRAKLTALTGLLDGIVRGPAPPRIALLHGPAGNGKLSTLKVVLRAFAAALKKEQAESTVATARDNGETCGCAEGLTHSPSLPPLSSAAAQAGKRSANVLTSSGESDACRVHVLHSCQTSPMELCMFLRRITANCRGETNNAAASIAMEGDWGRQSSTGRKRGDAASLAEPLLNAYIIKFYGEPANHRLHEYTRAFMTEYEQLLDRARRALHPQAVTRSAGGDDGCVALARRLRRNLVFFLHTTHDSHSDKMDLGTAFPHEVLSSPALNLFHCTPVTELAVCRRLRAVLDREAERRWRGGRLTLPAMQRGVVALPPLATRRRSSKAAAPTARKRSAPHLSPAPTGDLLMSLEDVRSVAAASQGDMRQALLQVQWLTLLPLRGGTGVRDGSPARGNGAAPSRSTDASPPAERCGDGEEKQTKPLERMRIVQGILTRLASRDGSLIPRSDADDRGPLAPPLRACGDGGEKEEEEEGAGARAASDQRQGGVSEDDAISISSATSVEEDVVKAEESGPCRTPLPSPTGERAAGKAPGGVSAAGRASPVAPEPRRQRKRSVWDMMERALEDGVASVDMEDETSGSRSQPPRSPPPAKRRRAETRGSGATHHVRSEDGEDHRVVAATIRDEYMGLSHATARLLTQKYKLSDVLGVLSVAPRHLLSYLTNNLPAYFLPHQLTAYAACVMAGSEADALRVLEGGAGLQGGAQFRRNALDARTRGHGTASNRTAGAEDGPTGVAEPDQLDLMALTLFERSYRVLHTEVHVPRAFVAHRPPPFQRTAYPRVRTLPSPLVRRQWLGQAEGGGGWEARVSGTRGGEELEAEWLHRLARTESREGCGGTVGEGQGDTSRRVAGGVGQAARLGRAFAPPSGANASATSAVPALPGEDMDVLREALPAHLDACGPLDHVLLEYAPFAKYIVLDRPPPASEGAGVAAAASIAPWSARGGVGSSTLSDTSASSSAFATQQHQASQRASSCTAHSQINDTASSFFTPSPPPSTQSTQPPPAVSAPRRTVFKFAAAAGPAHKKPPPPRKSEGRRPCTELQYRLLRRGLPVRASLRRDAFYLVPSAHTASIDEGGAGVAGDGGAVPESTCERSERACRPLMPDGDTIEDFSD